MRTTLASTLTLVLLAISGEAADPIYTKNGLALAGYDAVAYFTEGKAVKGSKDFATDWSGVRWRFATAAHRDAFRSEPARYAPQFGGYCAYGVTRGYKAKAEPDAWTIVDGKLYLNYDREVQKLWEKDVPGMIALAENKWPGVVDN